jgi:hypothetical protein
MGRRIVPTIGGALEITAFPVFHKHGFDPGEEASPQISEIGQCNTSGV